MEDDFESNQYNWSELSSSRGKAIIQDGVLHLESSSKFVLSTCYAPFDINKPFVFTVEALAKKIDNRNLFGILLDYEDEQNYILFYISDDEAKLEIWKENKLVGYKEEALKLRKGKKVGIDFEVEYNLNELIFKVNGVRAMAYRRRISKDDSEKEHHYKMTILSKCIDKDRKIISHKSSNKLLPYSKSPGRITPPRLAHSIFLLIVS